MLDRENRALCFLLSGGPAKTQNPLGEKGKTDLTLTGLLMEGLSLATGSVRSLCPNQADSQHDHAGCHYNSSRIQRQNPSIRAIWGERDRKKKSQRNQYGSQRNTNSCEPCEGGAQCRMFHKYLANQGKNYQNTRMRVPGSKETDLQRRRIHPRHLPTKQRQ